MGEQSLTQLNNSLSLFIKMNSYAGPQTKSTLIDSQIMSGNKTSSA